MSRKQFTVEQIIVKLREIEILCGQGQSVGDACRQSQISEQTYYRWRQQYSGMNTSKAKQLQMLEKENARLKKIIVDQTLDIAILKDVNSKNF